MFDHLSLSSCCIVLIFILGGCEEQIAAPGGVEEPYSLFGILNARRDTQTVAVSPIEPLLHDFPDSIDVRLSSTELGTGETHMWRDSVVVGERGQTDHVFFADFRARFGSTHRLTATRSDGAQTSVVARIPEVVEVTNDDSRSQIFYVNISGHDFRLNGIEVLYTVRHYAHGPTGGSIGSRFDPDDAIEAFCKSPRETYSITYTGNETETDGGYRFDVHLILDHYEVLKRYQYAHNFEYIPEYSGIGLLKMEVRLIVGEEAWAPPDGKFNRNALAQPRTMSNVENGYGFVGGGFYHEAHVFPSREAVESTDFFDFIQRPPTECFDFCTCRQTEPAAK